MYTCSKCAHNHSWQGSSNAAATCITGTLAIGAPRLCTRNNCIRPLLLSQFGLSLPVPPAVGVRLGLSSFTSTSLGQRIAATRLLGLARGTTDLASSPVYGDIIGGDLMSLLDSAISAYSYCQVCPYDHRGMAQAGHLAIVVLVPSC